MVCWGCFGSSSFEGGVDCYEGISQVYVGSGGDLFHVDVYGVAVWVCADWNFVVVFNHLIISYMYVCVPMFTYYFGISFVSNVLSYVIAVMFAALMCVMSCPSGLSMLTSCCSHCIVVALCAARSSSSPCLYVSCAGIVPLGMWMRQSSVRLLVIVPLGSRSCMGWILI